MSATLVMKDRRKRTALIMAGVAAGMLGLGFASVPLYRMFCQVTGFNGTTQRVSIADADKVGVLARTISVRFDANVERGMPWQFKPLQTTDTVRIGARDMAIFWAKNTSDKPITGTATFNVEPDYAGRYFNKVQCFCFTQQRLEPGEDARLPVIYYVDPAILQDKDAKDLEQITLSYTFHPDTTAGADANALDRTGRGS